MSSKPTVLTENSRLHTEPGGAENRIFSFFLSPLIGISRRHNNFLVYFLYQPVSLVKTQSGDVLVLSQLHELSSKGRKSIATLLCMHGHFC